jgi:CheY-like chemotaxis protein
LALDIFKASKPCPSEGWYDASRNVVMQCQVMSTLHGTAACLLTLLSITVALMLTRGGETQPNRTQERFMRDSAISGPYSLIIVDLPMPSPSTTQATRTIREDLCFFECDLWLKLCCRSDRPGIYYISLVVDACRCQTSPIR